MGQGLTQTTSSSQLGTAQLYLFSANQLQAQSTGSYVCLCLSTTKAAEGPTVLLSVTAHLPHQEQPGICETKPKAAGKFTGHLANSWFW